MLNLPKSPHFIRGPSGFFKDGDDRSCSHGIAEYRRSLNLE
jgi:hypothetical protein